MTTIEINGPITAKAHKRLCSKTPLTIEIKGVGTFQAYSQTFDMTREVHKLCDDPMGGPYELIPGQITIKLGLSNLFRKRVK